jgi:hypothetical protein
MASTTLTYGRKVPSNGDKGSSFFGDLEDNIALDDAHNHNGTNSALIDAKNITKGSNTILAASWAAVSGQSGTYKQTVTLPSGYTMGSITMCFYDNTTGHQFYPTIEKVSSSTYDIYVNDNTLVVKAVYA